MKAFSVTTLVRPYQTAKRKKPKKPKAKRFFVMRWLAGVQSFVEGLKVRITNEQQVRVTVAPKTQGGRDAKIDGGVTFSSTDEAVATVEAIDAYSALVKAVGSGVTQIKASFDADLGEGVREIELTGALEVVDAEAVTGEIVFGEPEAQPQP